MSESKNIGRWRWQELGGDERKARTDELVHIKVVGDGSCFFHCILTCLHDTYLSKEIVREHYEDFGQLEAYDPEGVTADEMRSAQIHAADLLRRDIAFMLTEQVRGPDGQPLTTTEAARIINTMSNSVGRILSNARSSKAVDIPELRDKPQDVQRRTWASYTLENLDQKDTLNEVSTVAICRYNSKGRLAALEGIDLDPSTFLEVASDILEFQNGEEVREVLEEAMSETVSPYYFQVLPDLTPETMTELHEAFEDNMLFMIDNLTGYEVGVGIARERVFRGVARGDSVEQILLDINVGKVDRYNTFYLRNQIDRPMPHWSPEEKHFRVNAMKAAKFVRDYVGTIKLLHATLRNTLGDPSGLRFGSYKCVDRGVYTDGVKTVTSSNLEDALLTSVNTMTNNFFTEDEVSHLLEADPRIGVIEDAETRSLPLNLGYFVHLGGLLVETYNLPSDDGTLPLKLSNLLKLLLPTSGEERRKDVGEEDVIPLIPLLLDIDIFIMEKVGNSIRPKGPAYRGRGENLPVIVLLWLNRDHFEVIGLKGPEGETLTAFQCDHPFILAIKNYLRVKDEVGESKMESELIMTQPGSPIATSPVAPGAPKARRVRSDMYSPLGDSPQRRRRTRGSVTGLRSPAATVAKKLDFSGH